MSLILFLAEKHFVAWLVLPSFALLPSFLFPGSTVRVRIDWKEKTHRNNIDWLISLFFDSLHSCSRIEWKKNLEIKKKMKKNGHVATWTRPPPLRAGNACGRYRVLPFYRVLRRGGLSSTRRAVSESLLFLEEIEKETWINRVLLEKNINHINNNNQSNNINLKSKKDKKRKKKNNNNNSSHNKWKKKKKARKKKRKKRKNKNSNNSSNNNL